MNNHLREQWSDSGIDVPKDWDFRSIEELLETPKSISVGVMYPGSDTPGGIPLIRVGDVSNGFVTGLPEYCVSDQVDREYRRSKLVGNELLITLVGEPGECVIATDKMKGWNVARALAVLRLKDSTIRHWLRYVLHSRTAKYLIGARLNTTVQKTLNLKDIRELAIPFPPVHIRSGIEEIIGSIDEKIELNHKQNCTLEAIAQALFKRWFVEFEFPDQNGQPYKSSGGVMQSSVLGEIPVGWGGVLADVVEQRNERISPSQETKDMPYVPIDCISSQSLFLQESKNGEEAQSSLIRFYEGDILFGAMRPYFHKVCIAPFDGTTRATCFVLLPRVQQDFSYVTLILHNAGTIDFATKHSTGSTIPYAKWEGTLDTMEIPLPPAELRAAFDTLVRPLLDRIPVRYFENNSLAGTRDSLLPKLMSGELKVV